MRRQRNYRSIIADDKASRNGRACPAGSKELGGNCIAGAIALATDGDGDRIGAMDADGRFINPHQIMALLTRYLVEKRGWTGGVAQTVTVSELVKRVAAQYGLRLHQTPVGFKHIACLMLTEDILIGGEESGGIGIKNYIQERDGLLLGFLLTEAVAAYGKTLGTLIDERRMNSAPFITNA